MENTLQKWSTLERLVFRFAFLLLGLFMVFFNNGTLPMFYVIMKYPLSLLHVFIPWLGKAWLKLPYPITEFTNGSGDTTYDFVVLLCVAVLALVGTLVWSLLDRKRTNYNRLFYWLSVAVRFYVGAMLINYGMVKVVQLQFPAPNLFRLVTTYGESSPMGLAWTFLGFSKGYNLFMGIAEVSAGLLFFRKTVTLGTIISLMTTANIMAVNYFYDVPVKIVTTALVVMCLFLLAPNFVRLFNFFVRGHGATLRTLESPVVVKKWKRITKYSLKYLLIAFIVIGSIWKVVSLRSVYGRDAPKSLLYGAYEVETFIKNGQTIPKETERADRWKMLILESPDEAAIKMPNGEYSYPFVRIDTAKKKMVFSITEDMKAPSTLDYRLPDSNKLWLKGVLFGDSVEITLKKMRFELTERQLNWINERPYNR
ncbi:hypothetical protein VRU48_10670 [Pedobacter sp. KR3-3]|uniref:DoxX family protein n=1 Tax=Pedobacter albus TaxID=3113905 RepID=A0ABU7I7X8_9SPHI|nr:hypothetical protein [Pedobacter sp. KR3-3]MEE1945569.1 hypothetical protein [Pedobacter sp. KR3-3]